MRLRWNTRRREKESEYIGIQKKMRDSYIDVLENYVINALEKGSVDFEKQIEEIKEILDLESDMLASYSAIAHLDGKVFEDYTKMAIVVFSKNLDYIYAAFSLTLRGEYAAARVLFRNVYESLIILKTIAITNRDDLTEAWLNGRIINLNREVFKKIEHPTSEEMEELWIDLCRFCHGTVFSNPLSYDYSKNRTGIEYNYIVLKMLLYMNHHVLNRYAFSDNMKAMADRNICIYDDYSLKEKREMLRGQLKLLKNGLRKRPQKVLTDFVKVWKFKI